MKPSKRIPFLPEGDDLVIADGYTHCEECGGDGGGDYPARWNYSADEPEYGWAECDACDGTGQVLQWAEAHFSAAHRGEDGGMHGHTWRVRAYWPYAGGNIEFRKTTLQEQAKLLCHRELRPDLTRAEQLAEWFGKGLSACRVDVWRESEGMGATWTA